MKACSKCKQVKLVTAFAIRTRKDGSKTMRAACKECENAQQRARGRGGKGHGRRLPVEPFREWLEKKIAEHESYEDVSHLVGLNPRRIYEIRYRSKFVSLYLVDDCLTRDGTTALWELYPDA